MDEEQREKLINEIYPSFNKWWDEHGKYSRAGGGEYKRTFAWNAWLWVHERVHNRMSLLDKMERAKTEYNQLVTQCTIAPIGDPIHSTRAFTVTICDEGAGEFLAVRQMSNGAEISIEIEQWEVLKGVIESMFIDHIYTELSEVEK